MHEQLEGTGEERTLQERIVEQFPQYTISRNGLLVIRSKYYKGGEIEVRPEGILKAMPSWQEVTLSRTERSE